MIKFNCYGSVPDAAVGEADPLDEGTQEGLEEGKNGLG